MSTQSLSLLQLRPHPHNRPIDPDHVASLASSMQESGQWDSIRVRPVDGGMFEILAGHHRVEAALLLGWVELRAEICNLSDEEADAELLDSNLRRKGLSADEEARGIKRMINTYNWTQQRIAERFHRSQKWVSERLALVNDLVPAVRELIPQGIIQPSHAVQIARAPQEVQPAIARRVAESDLSKAETERLVKVVSDPSTPADVRQAALQEPKVTAAHAEAIAKVTNATVRKELLADVAHGRLTVDEAAREAQAVIKREEAPTSIASRHVERRLSVFPALTKAKEALDAIEVDDLYNLEPDALVTAEAELGRIASRLNRLSQAVATARDRTRRKPREGTGKLVALRNPN